MKQAVIVPILRALDWDDADPAEFVPEYSVDSGRVDYALLGPKGAPLVFVEAKGIGRVGLAGEEQLFRYAVNKGVPFLILTDGDLWDFYLSMAAGVPAERRFYRAKLTREEGVADHAGFFEEDTFGRDANRFWRRPAVKQSACTRATRSGRKPAKPCLESGEACWRGQTKCSVICSWSKWRVSAEPCRSRTMWSRS